MKYIVKYENEATLTIFEPTKTNIKKFEKMVNKNIEQINKELKENGYFIFKDMKCYLSTIFID